MRNKKLVILFLCLFVIPKLSFSAKEEKGVAHIVEILDNNGEMKVMMTLPPGIAIIFEHGNKKIVGKKIYGVPDDGGMNGVIYRGKMEDIPSYETWVMDFSFDSRLNFPADFSKFNPSTVGPDEIEKQCFGKVAKDYLGRLERNTHIVGGVIGISSAAFDVQSTNETIYSRSFFGCSPRIYFDFHMKYSDKAGSKTKLTLKEIKEQTKDFESIVKSVKFGKKYSGYSN